MRLILLVFLSLPAAALADGRVAFFGLRLIDGSNRTTVASGLVPAEIGEEDSARLRALEMMARDRFADEGFIFLDLGPVAADLDRVANPANCYGCDTRMAAKLGADFILVGELTRVSRALLSLWMHLRDGETGAVVRGGAVEIRGDTDDMWRRGMRYLLNNRIFREEIK